MELSNDDNTNLSSPFGQMGQGLSESELRETCYEILIGACRSAGGSRPLTYVSSSVKRNVEKQPSISLQRSVSSVAASKMKRALGLKKAVRGDSSRGGDREVTIGELMRVQMRVSEQTDSRVRRGLLRIAATQVELSACFVFLSVILIYLRNFMFSRFFGFLSRYYVFIVIFLVKIES